VNPSEYEDVVKFTEHIRVMARSLVASLVDDGFTEEQARGITTGIFSNMAPSGKDSE